MTRHFYKHSITGIVSSLDDDFAAVFGDRFERVDAPTEDDTVVGADVPAPVDAPVETPVVDPASAETPAPVVDTPAPDAATPAPADASPANTGANP